MKLIIGLGNPGSEYVQTRHNLGFMVLDSFASAHSLTFSEKSKFKASIAEGRLQGEKVLLAKPTTFYNLVGESFRAMIDFYKLTSSNVLIVHDDLALPFGTIRVREGGSDAGNNGVKSINQHGGEQTIRLRIGIANTRLSFVGETDFVLSKMPKNENDNINTQIIPHAINAIETFTTGLLEPTSRSLTLE